MYYCLLVVVFLFAVEVSTQETYLINQERNLEAERNEKKIASNPELIFFPGPTYRPNIRYHEDDLNINSKNITTTTTTSKPTIVNYIQPREYEDYEEDGEDDEYDGGGSCVLTSTPPDPSSKCCGVDASTRNRIVGGSPTAIEQYPWLVQIEYEDTTTGKPETLCAGFLISGRYSLSAAHCFAGEVLKKGRPASIIVGDYNISNPGPDCVSTPSGERLCTEGAKTVPIENYIVHPKYYNERASISNDIALVRTKRSVEYSVFIRPLCLPTRDITEGSTNSHLRFVVAGWGAVEDKLLKNYRHLYKRDYIKRDVDVPFVDRKKCSETFTFLNQGHICAGGERGKDSCKSDSGGPLMYQDYSIYEAVGIVSTGLEKYECGTEDRPAVYTKVYPYMNWIKKNIKP